MCARCYEYLRRFTRAHERLAAVTWRARQSRGTIRGSALSLPLGGGKSGNHVSVSLTSGALHESRSRAAGGFGQRDSRRESRDFLRKSVSRTVLRLRKKRRDFIFFSTPHSRGNARAFNQRKRARRSIPGGNPKARTRARQRRVPDMPQDECSHIVGVPLKNYSCACDMHYLVVVASQSHPACP